MPIPRRDIAELHAKYDLHPELFDIYVEGDFDYDFLNLFLSSTNIQSASVFSIDDICVEPANIERFGLQKGSNKHRVLALAKLLDERYGNRNTNIVCIADADRDRILDRLELCHHAIYTDYTCLECYLLNESCLRKFLTFVCQLPAMAAEEFIGIAKSVLPVQFSLRAALEALQINESILGFESGLIRKRDISTFDTTKYLNSFLAHHALQSLRETIISKFHEIFLTLPADLRHAVQGHDFITILFEYIYSKDSLKFHNKQENILKFGGRIVAMSCDQNQLVHEKLFAKIERSGNGGGYMNP